MAKVDPERRAQIGQEKRAKTRAQLISAATSLFAKRAVESVTVDDIVNEARVAKGTFSLRGVLPMIDPAITPGTTAGEFISNPVVYTPDTFRGVL